MQIEAINVSLTRAVKIHDVSWEEFLIISSPYMMIYQDQLATRRPTSQGETTVSGEIAIFVLNHSCPVSTAIT